MDAVIRPATDADTAGIGLVQVLAWQTAYRGIMPDAYLDALDPGQRAAMWAGILSENDDDHHIVVVELAGRIVGFAAFGPARADDRPATGELYAINVVPDTWRTGHGRVLLRAVTAALAEAGFVDAELFVATDNKRARGFYETEGWSRDGDEVVEDVMGATVREVRYRRSLHG